MKPKSEVIASVDPTKTYLGSYVIARINEVECDDTFIPSYLKKGDVILKTVGGKRRPCVIIKVLAEMVIILPLTSSENIHNLCESRSRFFREGWFSNTYDVEEIKWAKMNFIGVYDNNKDLNNAIKQLRIFITKNV